MPLADERRFIKVVMVRAHLDCLIALCLLALLSRQTPLQNGRPVPVSSDCVVAASQPAQDDRNMSSVFITVKQTFSRCFFCFIRV